MRTINGKNGKGVKANISRPSPLDYIPAMVAKVGKDLRYRYVNPEYEKWSARPAGQIIGKTIAEVWGEDTFTGIEQYVNNVLSGKKCHFENKVHNNEGLRYVEVFFTPEFSKAKKVVGYTMLANDITEKKETEKILLTNNNLLKDYIENAPIGLHWVSEKGIILWANNTELDMLGYTREEYIGHHISEFHVDEKGIADILTRLSSKETLSNHAITLRHKDGSLRHAIINSNVLWENDKFIHTRCFTLDVTEKKIAEEKLRETQIHYT